jgi:glycerophosphoryl diester phosphodiesterase
MGVDTLETDIAVTRDGVLVISHDSALNPDITRGPDGQFLDGRGPVIRHTDFAELLRYDVGRIKPGSNYAGAAPRAAARWTARGCPRLADLFALVKKSGNPKRAPGAGDQAQRRWPPTTPWRPSPLHAH